jgi:hypothetical protein
MATLLARHHAANMKKCLVLIRTIKDATTAENLLKKENGFRRTTHGKNTHYAVSVFQITMGLNIDLPNAKLSRTAG